MISFNLRALTFCTCIWVGLSVQDKRSWLEDLDTDPDAPQQPFPEKNEATISGYKYLFDSLAAGSSEPHLAFVTSRSLESYSTKSDCFRLASASIRSSCAEHGPDEDERIKASISMTLCEIATARHHSVPLECIGFNPGATTDDTQDIDASLCVEALSRSAQHWSSYAGYMREIPQLCTTFQRWHDLDAAKAVYRNATIEKIALLRLLNDRERKINDILSEWRERLQKYREISTSMEATKSSLERYNDQFVTSLDTLLRKTFRGFGEEIEVRRQHETEINNQIHFQMKQMLSNSLEKHSESLMNIADTVGRSLDVHANNIVNAAQKKTRELFMAVDRVGDQLFMIGTDVVNFHNSVRNLTSSVELASSQLEAHSKQALISYRSHVEMATSLTVLSQEIKTLINMTQEEFKAINASAEDIKYNLQSDLQRSIIKLSGNWKNITSVCIQLLYESSYFGYFLFLPVLSTFMRILKLGSFALSALLSLALRSVFSSVKADQNGFGRMARIPRNGVVSHDSLVTTRSSPASRVYTGQNFHNGHVLRGNININDWQRYSSNVPQAPLGCAPRPALRISRIPSRLWNAPKEHAYLV